MQFKQFHDKIHVPPSIVCASCNKTFYPAPSLHTINLKVEHDIAGMLKSLTAHTDSVELCSPCYNKLKVSTIPPQSLLNNMYVAPTPDLLAGLNVAEQRLISPIHAFLKLVVLPYGQSAINGQIINFPYDVNEMLNQPRSADNFIIIKTKPDSQIIPKEFTINMDKIQQAVSWLNKNNLVYPDINSLPLNPGPIIIHAEQKTDKSTEVHVVTADAHNGLDTHCNIIESSIIRENPSMPKTNLSDIAIGNNSIPVYQIKSNNNNPINTFSGVNLEQLAFPVLFPTGQNGLFTPRKYPLSHIKYFQAILLSADCRWSSHLPYLFWSTNLTEKKKLSDNISISQSNNRKTALCAGVVRSELKSNPDFPENFQYQFPI